jgi:hypothetical protein
VEFLAIVLVNVDEAAAEWLPPKLLRRG